MEAKIIGLTGGIGSGKSIVTHYLSEKGVPIIDADLIARQIVKPSQPALPAIVSVFGEDILTTSGELDRKALGKIVFSDKQKRKQLEAILHPQIRKGIKNEIQNKKSDYPYILVDIPLLIEQNYQSLFDQIWVVDCLPEQQIQRVRQRDNLSRNEIKNIMASQANHQQRLHFADKVLDNSGSLDKLYRQLDQYHNLLINKKLL